MILKLSSAFPTVLIEWDDNYTFVGELATTNSNGETSCLFAKTESAIPFASYPQPTATMLTWSDSSNGETITDNEGLFFTTTTVEEYMQGHSASFRDVGALQTCTLRPYPAPAILQLTAKFLTQTSTAFDGAAEVTPTSDSGQQQPSNQPSSAPLQSAKPSSSQDSVPLTTSGGILLSSEGAKTTPSSPPTSTSPTLVGSSISAGVTVSSTTSVAGIPSTASLVQSSKADFRSTQYNLPKMLIAISLTSWVCL